MNIAMIIVVVRDVSSYMPLSQPTDYTLSRLTLVLPFFTFEDLAFSILGYIIIV